MSYSFENFDWIINAVKEGFAPFNPGEIIVNSCYDIDDDSYRLDVFTSTLKNDRVTFVIDRNMFLEMKSINFVLFYDLICQSFSQIRKIEPESNHILGEN